MELTANELQAFMRLAGALSPENLHEDGEISQSEARAKERRLRREWQTLEAKLGRSVTEDEVWTQWMRTPGHLRARML